MATKNYLRYTNGKKKIFAIKAKCPSPNGRAHLLEVDITNKNDTVAMVSGTALFFDLAGFGTDIGVSVRLSFPTFC